MLFIDAPHISFPEGGTVQLLLRWVHYMAGIAWVGLLYFFMLVNTPFLQQADPATRAKVVTQQLPRAWWWFRWASVITVLAGIWYWMMIVTADAHNAHTKGGGAIGTFFGLWTLAFVIEMGLLMAPAEILRKGVVFGSIMTVVLAAASWFYLALNAHGWESNRLLAIGIGGGMGWFMMLNVWGIIWRMQKKVIRFTAESAAGGSAMPPETARLARITMLAARTNFILSFPMLLMMAVASHYPVFGL